MKKLPDRQSEVCVLVAFSLWRKTPVIQHRRRVSSLDSYFMTGIISKWYTTINVCYHLVCVSNVLCQERCHVTCTAACYEDVTGTQKTITYHHHSFQQQSQTTRLGGFYAAAAAIAGCNNVDPTSCVYDEVLLHRLTGCSSLAMAN